MKKGSAPDKIVYNDEAYRELEFFLTTSKPSKVFVLCDENTQTHCIPFFFQQLEGNYPTEIIEIESGEAHKNIATCQELWALMSDMGGDRNAVLINLGGGIITDLGGFVASTFLRGIPFINIPTSLLGMVDAAVGGKTGVNRGFLKNQIGLFSFAELTLIDVRFLGTLPQRQLKSGLAEMYKHGLIADKTYWHKLSDLSQLNLNDLETLVKTSIAIKSKVVAQDQQEKSLRKILNFGHTLGHAIESYFLDNEHKKSLLHGEAIAIGMILESYLSVQICGLEKAKMLSIKQVLLHTFSKIKITKKDIDEIISLLKFDKKNKNGVVNFVLLEDIGQPKIDCHASEKLIKSAFEFYLREEC